MASYSASSALAAPAGELPHVASVRSFRRICPWPFFSRFSAGRSATQARRAGQITVPLCGLSLYLWGQALAGAWAGAHARRLLGRLVRGRSLAITARRSCAEARNVALQGRSDPSPLLDRDKCLLPVPTQPVGAVQQVGSSGSTTNSCCEHRHSHHPSLMPRNHRPTTPRRAPNFYHRPFPIQMSGVLIQLTESTEDPFSLTAAGDSGRSSDIPPSQR